MAGAVVWEVMKWMLGEQPIEERGKSRGWRMVHYIRSVSSKTRQGELTSSIAGE